MENTFDIFTTISYKSKIFSKEKCLKKECYIQSTFFPTAVGLQSSSEIRVQAFQGAWSIYWFKRWTVRGHFKVFPLMPSYRSSSYRALIYEYEQVCSGYMWRTMKSRVFCVAHLKCFTYGPHEHRRAPFDGQYSRAGGWLGVKEWKKEITGMWNQVSWRNRTPRLSFHLWKCTSAPDSSEESADMERWSPFSSLFFTSPDSTLFYTELKIKAGNNRAVWPPWTWSGRRRVLQSLADAFQEIKRQGN